MKRSLLSNLPNLLDVQDELTSEASVRIIPLRTETALSKFPIHRLSKKGTIKIRQTKKNEDGKPILWEVRHSPGPLGYKIDTTIVNRRIDEYRNRGEIPKLIKLGSLGHICEELGLKLGGRTVERIKEALMENAGALITANLDYRTKDGDEGYFEFSDTRYAIILTGRKLPNGKKADGVYILFHDLYLTLLNQAQIRPLDYEYLKSLPPASQRLYELISFNIYGALHHGRDCATMIYSELCANTPLTRYEKWDQGKKQLYKVHKPHLVSGYLKDIDYQSTMDNSGQPDWIIRYTPGPRARQEYWKFNERPRAQLKRPRLVAANVITTESPEEVPRPIEDNALTQKSEDAMLIEILMNFGVDNRQAAHLVEADREESKLWASAWPYQNQSGMENPPAVLISFIKKKRRPLPEGYKQTVDFEQRKKDREKEHFQKLVAELHYEYFTTAYRRYLSHEIQTIARSNSEAYQAFTIKFENEISRIESDAAREEFRLRKASDFFQFPTFDDWNQSENRDQADPEQWFASNPELVNKLLGVATVEEA